MNTALIDNVQSYILTTLNNKLPNGFLYHNYTHTLRVVKHVKELIEVENLSDPDKEIVLLAAWFHDLGYINTFKDHEEESAKLASDYLLSENYPKEKIEIISRCILSTSKDIEPESSLEKILADADFSHFASENYTETSDLLREELNLLGVKTFTDEEWITANIEMFNQHHKFYTNHAAINWQPKKNRNFLDLTKKLNKLQAKVHAEKIKKDSLDLKKKKSKMPERGIDTIFRISLRNHINLSSIADTKANILLSVNAIIISLVLSNLIPKLDNPSNSHLVIPTIIFVCFSAASMTLSILATRPKVTTTNFTMKDVEDKKVNLLFFGNFYKLDVDEYLSSMRVLINDREYLYDTLSKDLYFLGKVLVRKYKLLRLTYTIFLIGIIVSIISFAIAFNYALRT